MFFGTSFNSSLGNTSLFGIAFCLSANSFDSLTRSNFSLLLIEDLMLSKIFLSSDSFLLIRSESGTISRSTLWLLETKNLSTKSVK